MSDNEMVVGRIVHYKYHGTCRAAIVVKVWTALTVNLTVFGDHSFDRALSDFPDHTTFPKTSVIMGEQDGQWHWPRECQNK